MKILFSNLRLNHFAGSEIWTYHMIEELLHQGHVIEIYTQQKGEIYRKLIALGAQQFQYNDFDLGILNHYDCIDELSKIKGLEIKHKIQTCHGLFPPPERPHHWIDQYVSITKEVHDHLQKINIHSRILYNPVNLKRFKRINPINETVKKVLILCVGKRAQQKCARVCKTLNIQYEIHSKWNDPVFDLENKINEFDLVIGYGRGIIEAICCGRNVIVYDSRKYTPEQGEGLLTKFTFNLSLSCNFTGRATNRTLSITDIAHDIQKATIDSAKWLYMQRNLFDVQTITKNYLS